jgi:uncharacterized membrane protein YgcG
MTPLRIPLGLAAASLTLLHLASAQRAPTIVGTAISESGTAECFGPLATDWVEPRECALLTLGIVTDPAATASYSALTTDHWVFRGGYPQFPALSASCMPPRTRTSADPRYAVPVYYTAAAAACPAGWAMATSRALGGGTTSGRCCAAGYTLPANGFPLCVSDGCGDRSAAAYATGQGAPGAPPTLVLAPTTIGAALGLACSATGVPIEVRWSAQGGGGGNDTGSGAGGGGSGGGGGGGNVPGSLSDGGKIAVGVVVPVGFIALAALGWFAYRRRRRRAAVPDQEPLPTDPGEEISVNNAGVQPMMYTPRYREEHNDII